MVPTLDELSRAEALALLRLRPGASPTEVDRAYRRLAREVHPDVGGSDDRFHRLQSAYRRLVTDGTGRRPSGPADGDPARGPGGAWGEAPARRFSGEAPDLAAVDWRAAPPAPPYRLDRARLAVALAAAAPTPVSPVVASSRGPRSALNRAAAVLDSELTARLSIGPAAGDRGHRPDDVEAVLRLRSRATRKRADAAVLPPTWVVHRGSSTTTIASVLHPSQDRRATAVRVVDAVATALDALDWPLGAWTVVAVGSDPPAPA